MSILTRSPFIVLIDQPTQVNTKLEIFLYNGSVVPALPTYTFSKVIPTITNRETIYNITPFMREFITNIIPNSLYNAVQVRAVAEYANALVKRYANNFFLTQFTTRGFDGYSLHTEGQNFNSPVVHRTQGNYRYWYDVNNNPLADTTVRAGNITVETGVNWNVRYTNLFTGAVITVSLTNNEVVNVPCVWGANYANGNMLDILDTDGTIQATYVFRPIEECRYNPVRVDFINRYGAWQREWFFKASNETLDTQSTNFNLMSQNWNYSVSVGQKQEFNVDGRISVKINSGFVNEFFGGVIEEILLSEKILVDGLPVTRKTQSTEKFKDVNTKMINYGLEFEVANTVLNNIQ